jgi:antitoxin HigA-1
MAAKRESPGIAPPHPGEYLREDILPALGMTIKDLADHLGVTRTTLSELVNEKRTVSLDMAQRLGKAFGNGTRFWLALQMRRDVWLNEQEHPVSVERLRWETEAA